MTRRLLCLLALVPIMAKAQIVLYSLSGTTPSPLGSVYGYGQVAAGDLKDVRFRALNTGTASVTITLLKVVNTAGAGFSIVNSSSTPFVVAPGNVMDFFVRFSATPVTSYSATLQVNTASAILLATVVPAPTLTVAPPCYGPDSNGAISFGRISQGTSQACTLSILNPFLRPLTISPLTVTGAAFTTSSASAVTVAAGQSTSFTIQFTPATASSFSGTLTVGPRTYTLSGAGFIAPLPSLMWTFDANTISSGEQHALSLQLSAPASADAAGSVTLSFTPSASGAPNDTSVQFVATSKRVASFAVSAGSTAVTLNAQPNIVFSTGTTSGTLTFTVDPGIFGLSGSPATSLTTQPAPVSITSSGVTSRASELDVVISGFDNTYSMGVMSFAFFDRGGASITTLSADFTANFRAFYQNQTAGSSFLMRLTFGITGDVGKIGAVEVTFDNSVGTVRTPRLNFP